MLSKKKKKNAILLFYSLQNEKHPPFFPYSLIVFLQCPINYSCTKEDVQCLQMLDLFKLLIAHGDVLAACQQEAMVAFPDP